MYKPHVITRIGLITVLALAGTVAGTAVHAQDTTPIKIGLGVAQSSNAAAFGQEQIIGARLAEQYFNENGGVNGRPIEVILQDTADTETTAINAFNTLIGTDQVVAILGPTLSQQAFAADPLAEQAGVPVLGPSNLAKGIPQIGDYIGRISAPATDMSPTVVRTVTGLFPDLKRAAVFYAQNDAFSKSETVVFQDALKAQNIEIVTIQTFNNTDTDFTAQITNAQALQPDLVVISGLAADGANLVRQIREFGYEGVIIGGNGLNASYIFPICQIECDGMYLTQAYNYTLNSEINNAFRALYKADQDKEPSQFAAQAFAGIQAFVESLRRVDEATPLNTLDLAATRTALRDALWIGVYDTPLGEVRFTPEGEVLQDQFYVAQVKMNPDGQSGQFVFLDVESDPSDEATAESTSEPTQVATVSR